jgi:glyoxylase-like metal-dependent hydrolase (beta-lactamase superfamily II)
VRLAALLTLALLNTACSVHIPTEVRARPETISSEPIDWAAVFANPTQLEVYPLIAGTGDVDRDFLLYIDHERIEDQEDRIIHVPILAYLARHPVHGDFLIDTGFDHTFTDDTSGNFGGLAALGDWVEQRPGHDTVSLLRELGVDPETLTFVVISHLHPDHTAGLPDLPKHLPVYCGPNATRGYESWNYWFAPADHFAGYQRVHTYDFSGIPDEGPGPAIDLFGDGSFFVISTPGHLHGNMSFVVNGPRGPVLLTCDASHLQEGFQKRVRPGGVIDEDQAQRTVERLHEWAKQHPTLRVKAGHDPQDWDMSRGIQDPL